MERRYDKTGKLVLTAAGHAEAAKTRPLREVIHNFEASWRTNPDLSPLGEFAMALNATLSHACNLDDDGLASAMAALDETINLYRDHTNARVQQAIAAYDGAVA